MSESPVRQQERSRLSTARLLDAAAVLIAERGYAGTTLALIGQRAGYSHGLVSRRFGSKEGLLWALVERYAVAWSHEILSPRLSTLGATDALHAVIESLRLSARESTTRMNALYSLMFQALQPIPMLREHMQQLHRDDRAFVHDLVERGVREGDIDPATDVAAVARLYIGALRGAAFQALLDPDHVDLDDAFADLHLLIDGLVPAPGASRRRT